MEIARYEVVETLRNGQRATIRALRRDDRDGLLAAMSGIGTQSLYRRFFSPKRNFTEKEIAFFLNADFVDHLALVAVLNEYGRPMIVGGARCIVIQPGRAEVAFTVVDRYQRQGLGGLLLHHLAAIARQAGIKELMAEVLTDNLPMLQVFEKSGLHVTTKQDGGVFFVGLQL